MHACVYVRAYANICACMYACVHACVQAEEGPCEPAFPVEEVHHLYVTHSQVAQKPAQAHMLIGVYKYIHLSVHPSM